MSTVQEALSQGWQFQRAGQLQAAEQVYRQVLQAAPDHPETLYLLGTVYQRQGKLDDAAHHLLAAVSLQPDYAEAHNNLGVVMAMMGRRLDACTHFRHVLRLRPNDADAANNLGNALREQGELDDAVERLRYALQLRPKYPDALHNLGLALHGQGKLDEAVNHLQQAVRLRPDFPDAHADLGVIFAKQKRWDEALGHFQLLARMRPDRADGHMHLGAVLRELGRLEESADRLRRAASIDPKDANLRSSLGLTLQQLGQLREAEEQLRLAISLDPQHAGAHNNLGVTLAQQLRFPESITEYTEALRLAPGTAIYHRNRAISRLAQGDFEKGWPEFEHRCQCPGFVERRFPQPRWQGEPLQGKTILLYAEQGLGDTIQYIRFVAAVKKLGATVIFESPESLARLLSKVAGIDFIALAGERLPRFDVHCPLVSLPGALHITPKTIPAKVPYLFAEPERVESWRAQLSAMREFKIGIVWQGNAKQTGDRLRSIPLLHFTSLAGLPGVRLLSLQKEPGAEQLRELAGAVPIIDLAARLDTAGGAFLDTAAVMKNLDLVISCDTAIGHLAGGLGVPVWLALSAAADWRWFTGRDDTPWYPSMRLFRQTRLGHWDDVFDRMADAIRMKTTGDSRAISIPVSPGELLDKLTILEIKRERIQDAGKLQNINAELAALTAVREKSVSLTEELSALVRELKQVNEAIWEAEDFLRGQEKTQEFESKFIEMARSVYRNNDRRAAIKRQINQRLGAQFVEEKQHPTYE